MKLITPDMAQSNVKETLKVVENTLNSFLTSDNPNDYKKVHLITTQDIKGISYKV